MICFARKYAVPGNGPVFFRVWGRKGKGKRRTEDVYGKKNILSGTRVVASAILYHSHPLNIYKTRL